MFLFLKEKQKETYEEKHSTLNPHPQNILSYFPLVETLKQNSNSFLKGYDKKSN